MSDTNNLTYVSFGGICVFIDNSETYLAYK